MDKLKMESKDNVQGNIEKIRELFPNCVTEVLRDGKPTLAVDFDVLKQEMSDTLIDDKEERYQFTWPDKKKSILLANTPIKATLRPCKEESVNFDATENLYIEGDNLDVLKLLQETYLGKIKMIYIDPPYNTGNDFVYEDDFAMEGEEYKYGSGQYDEQGNRLVQNTESNGRFHTDWLNMIYPRLKVAKDLLSDDGAIFISIGDDEEANLIKLCDEIFGERNFIASICHKSRASVSNDRIISENHNHLIFYAKNMDVLFSRKDEIGDDPELSGFNFSDENGKYKLTPVDGPGGAKKGNPFYEFMGISGYWRYSKETMQKKYNEGLIVKTQKNLQQKYYLSQAEKSRKTVTTWWDEDFLTSSATSSLIKLMGGKYFDNPKNINLLLRIIKMIAIFDKNAIILDFFSGSATTAHAVMQLNAEDGGKRKFIMVQLPEKCDEKSEAYKAGYKNICEIGKERIRRAGKKIKEENDALKHTKVIDKPEQLNVLQALKGNQRAMFDFIKTQPEQDMSNNLDVGFRVLKLDSSNMKDVYYKPQDYTQSLLDSLESNIKEDRTPLDLLFQVMLDLGKPLSAKIEEKEVAGKHVYIVNDDDLIACFDDGITEEVVKEIAKKKPLFAVFRDSGLSSDSTSTNFDQIFATYSPNTERRVL